MFLSSAEGDETATWESGIPARMIKSGSVYYADIPHGSLANEPEIFEGIGELLANGSTLLISRTRPQVRSDQKIFRSPDLIDFDLSPQGVENSILGIRAKEKVRNTQHLLKLSVCNGDLKYATYPVLAGHFTGDGILYAEKAIDFYLKGAARDQGVSDADLAAMQAGQPNQWRTTQGYAPRPLTAIWSTPPYLHNGSVPTLDDLLKPAAQRPKSFPLGHQEYDPVKLGYTTDVAMPAFVFDTTQPGNSNAGHAYGVDLKDDDRRALLEYLKTR